MNKIKFFPALILLFSHALFLTPTNAEPLLPVPRNCYNEDSVRMQEGIAAMRGSFKHENLKKKEIEVTVTQSDDPSTSSTILDASGSKVPSGKILYAWGSTAAGNQPTKKISTPAKGSSTAVSLTIRDDECDMEQNTQITVQGK